MNKFVNLTMARTPRTMNHLLPNKQGKRREQRNIFFSFHNNFSRQMLIRDYKLPRKLTTIFQGKNIFFGTLSERNDPPSAIRNSVLA